MGSDVKQRLEVRGNGGEDSQDFAVMLLEMYAVWDGDLSHEAGIHRLVRRSPFDEGSRRTTCFAQVIVDGDGGPDWRSDPAAMQVRSYVLDPYQLVRDHRLGTETDRVHDVLAGDLSLILPEEDR